MEIIVYTVYLIGLLAAFSALVVSVFARLPSSVLDRGTGTGRFADIGAAPSIRLGAIAGRRRGWLKEFGTTAA